MKSALSINTFLGCTLGCRYCVVKYALDDYTKKRISNPDELFSELITHRFFCPDKTLLVINNKTDPFLPEVRQDTFRIVQRIEVENLKNPIMLISKLGLREEELEILENYPGKVYFLCSYSNMPKNVEPVSGKQLAALNILKLRKNVRSLHYFRPLIEGINDSSDSIEKVLEDVQGACDCSIVSGIRLTASLAEIIRNLNGDIQEWNGDSQHKYLPKRLLEKAVRIKDNRFPDYKLFKKTSCAISSLESSSDYNFNFLKGNCSETTGCLNKESCKLRSPPNTEEIARFAGKAGITNIWEYKQNKIFFKGSLSQEEKAFIAFNLNYPVGSEITKLSKFEEGISNG